MEKELAKKIMLLFVSIFEKKHRNEYSKDIQKLILNKWNEIKIAIIDDGLETEVIEIETQNAGNDSLELVESSLWKMLRKNRELFEKFINFTEKVEKSTSGLIKKTNTKSDDNSNHVFQQIMVQELNIFGSQTIYKQE